MSGGFEPWHTSGGGGADGGILSFATVGSTPAAAGASVSGTVATLQPADATHGGVIAASGAQTLAPAFTITGGMTFANNAGNTNVILSTNSLIDVRQSGNFLSFGNGSQALYNVFSGNTEPYLMRFDTTGTVNSAQFPGNFAVTFAATLAPSGTTQTVDWAQGSSQTVSAASTTGTLVLTFSNPVNGGRYVMETIGKTARVWTFPAAVKWAGGVAPTVTATDGAIDMFEFYYDGTIYVGRVIAQNVS